MVLPRYVQFASEAEANECIAKLNNTNIRESIVEVSKFTPRSKRDKPSQSNLYIKNFPENWDVIKCEAYIKNNFAKFGQLGSIKVQSDPKLGKLYAFVLL